jgi:SAM-dependent methyltransferase
MWVFYEVRGFPVHTVLNMETRERALSFPRGDIRLGFCESCGFISNVAFDPEQLTYCSECEEAQGFSPTFKSFSQWLGRYLVEEYQIRGKRILEIGCGKGDFLSLLCDLGRNRGIGFDPAYVEGRCERTKQKRMAFVKDFYGEKYSHVEADFVVCQMTLEHIREVGAFVEMVRRGLAGTPESIVFFQVPDVTRILRECAFEDIYYEHCSYFSKGSLSRLFASCGFHVLELQNVYDGQYLIIVSRPSDGPFTQEVSGMGAPEELRTSVLSFSSRMKARLEAWESRLTDLKESGKRVVLWGSGSKGVAFLNMLESSEVIKQVVDINPFRQGSFMAGTGQRVVPPEFLVELRPDVVVVMNPVYRDEIARNIGEMGLNPEILTM